MLNFFTK